MPILITLLYQKLLYQSKIAIRQVSVHRFVGVCNLPRIGSITDRGRAYHY